jgi:excisionase family DNA binding protein
MTDKKYLTVRETSELLRISVSTLNRLVNQHRIPSYKVSYRRLFDRDELVEWVRAQRSDGQG